MAALIVSLLILVFPTKPNINQQENSAYVQNMDTISMWLSEGQVIYKGELDISDVNRDDIINKLMTFYSQKHLGITYVGGLLEVPPVETMVVTLEGSDCVLFVEHTLAMSMTTMQGSSNFDDFVQNLAFLRYVDGVIDGYGSRLHYFSDWLRTNKTKNRIDILFQYESLPEIGDLSYMSQNRLAYRQLAEDDAMFNKIVNRERELNTMKPLRYIPQDDIPKYEQEFRTGDILTFVTTINGLDISHTAIVKRDGDRVGFYHASTTGSVITDPKTIYEYTLHRRNVKGILVARPIF